MNKLRVWWIPQVGAISEAFYVQVQSVEEGKMVNRMRKRKCDVAVLKTNRNEV